MEWLNTYGSAGASPSRLDSASQRTFIDEVEWLVVYGSAGASPSRLDSPSQRTFLGTNGHESPYYKLQNHLQNLFRPLTTCVPSERRLGQIMKEIMGIQRLEATTRRSRCNGDNWHMTWANDDKQYVGLCDGGGWPDAPGYTGERYNTRVFALSGDAENHTVEHLPNFPDLLIHPPPNCNRYYGFGILALDGHIYHFLSTPNHPFHLPDARFVGGKLIYSPDSGRSWHNQDGTTLRWESWDERGQGNMAFFCEPGDAFSLFTILQMGKNYEHNTDRYVYICAPNGNEEGTMNQLVMLRVPKGEVLNREAYEYFVSVNSDGTANWSADINARGVVCSFPSGWVNTKVHPYSWHPSVVYNAPLDVYMMANWGMGCSSDGMWFGKPSYLGFWTAANPWGPWTQIHEELAWTPDDDPGARAYQPQISPKWISEDGKSFWLVFTDFQVLDGKRPYYSFNYQEVKILAR